MRRLLLVAVALAGAVLLAVLGYAAWMLRYLRTPEFQQQLLQRARTALGTDVRVDRIDVSLLSGVTLSGIAVANPAPFTGDLLAADGFVLRYRLWPLLVRRLEVQRVALHRPRLAIGMDARGVFNYERLRGGLSPQRSGFAGPIAALPVRIVLSRLSVDDASIVVTDATRSRLVTVDDASLDSAFEVVSGTTTGKGTATIRTVQVGRRLFVHDATAPLVLTKRSLTLAPVRATLGGGELRGEVTVRLQGGFRYVADLESRGVRVGKLLTEAGAAASVTGTLESRSHFEGTGGLPTVTGRGSGRIADCRVESSRTFALVASLLGLAELARPSFDECRAEFRQAGALVTTPVLSLRGRALALDGSGRVNIDSGALDYDMRLALSPALFARLTRREMRGAFSIRPDGFATIDFHLGGTLAEPRTDLVERVGRGMAEDAIRRGLGRLLQRIPQR